MLDGPHADRILGNQLEHGRVHAIKISELFWKPALHVRLRTERSAPLKDEFCFRKLRPHAFADSRENLDVPVGPCLLVRRQRPVAVARIPRPGRILDLASQMPFASIKIGARRKVGVIRLHLGKLGRDHGAQGVGIVFVQLMENGHIGVWRLDQESHVGQRRRFHKRAMPARPAQAQLAHHGQPVRIPIVGTSHQGQVMAPQRPDAEPRLVIRIAIRPGIGREHDEAQGVGPHRAAGLHPDAQFMPAVAGHVDRVRDADLAPASGRQQRCKLRFALLLRPVEADRLERDPGFQGPVGPVGDRHPVAGLLRPHKHMAQAIRLHVVFERRLLQRDPHDMNGAGPPRRMIPVIDGVRKIPKKGQRLGELELHKLAGHVAHAREAIRIHRGAHQVQRPALRRGPPERDDAPRPDRRLADLERRGRGISGLRTEKPEHACRHGSRIDIRPGQQPGGLPGPVGNPERQHGGIDREGARPGVCGVDVGRIGSAAIRHPVPVQRFPQVHVHGSRGRQPDRNRAAPRHTHLDPLAGFVGGRAGAGMAVGRQRQRQERSVRRNGPDHRRFHHRILEPDFHPGRRRIRQGGFRHEPVVQPDLAQPVRHHQPEDKTLF